MQGSARNRVINATAVPGVVMAMAVMVAAMTGQSRTDAAEEAVAILAGGCFWCVESDFDQVPAC